MTTRALGAVLFVASVSLLSTGRLFWEVADYYPAAPSPDGVTAFDSRFQQLRAMLPPKGIIGYITDPGVSATDVNANAEFYLTQYALAPLIVVNSTTPRYLVGNFHHLTTTGSLRDKGYRLIKEFGNGIALLENENAKESR
ncbi:MAG TPA: hypothetical protein VFQ91_22305 [Bryobacteraceae bacterium]|nr:hypothetical protein [Bryobacteraceae bacterium]